MAKKIKAGVDDQDEDLENDSEDSEEEGVDKKDLDADEEDDIDEGAEDDEPAVRRNLSLIIGRKNREIAALKKKTNEHADENDDEDDDEQEEKIARQAGRIAQRMMEPMARDLDQKQIDIDISTFLADPKNAKFRRYERKARRYALHPSRREVPIGSIFKEIAFDDFASGAEDATQKQRDLAERTSARGNSFRSAPKSDSEKIRAMNFRSKEFQSLRERIGAGETIDLSEEG